jgi:hypothetical protein
MKRSHWITIAVLAVLGGLILIRRNVPKRSIEREVELDAQEWVDSANSVDLGALREQMLAAPVKRWWTKTTDRDEQRMEFNRWFLDESNSFPITGLEVSHAVQEWFDRGDQSFEGTITSHSGAKYHVRCDQYEDGADCAIKFVGN